MTYIKKYPLVDKEPYNEITAFIKKNDYKCRHCGKKANFAFKKNGLQGLKYGYDVTEGIEFLTLDHLIPRSIGGSDSLKNMQVLCSACNNKKSASIFETDIELFFKQCKDDWRYKNTKHFYLIQDKYFLYQIHKYSFNCDVIYADNLLLCFLSENTHLGRCIKIDNKFLQNKKLILG